MKQVIAIERNTHLQKDTNYTSMRDQTLKSIINNEVLNTANTTEQNRMNNPAQGQHEEPLTVIRTNNNQGEAQEEETRDDKPTRRRSQPTW